MSKKKLLVYFTAFAASAAQLLALNGGGYSALSEKGVAGYSSRSDSDSPDRSLRRNPTNVSENYGATPIDSINAIRSTKESNPDVKNQSQPQGYWGDDGGYGFYVPPTQFLNGFATPDDPAYMFDSDSYDIQWSKVPKNNAVLHPRVKY